MPQNESNEVGILSNTLRMKVVMFPNSSLFASSEGILKTQVHNVTLQKQIFFWHGRLETPTISQSIYGVFLDAYEI